MNLVPEQQGITAQKLGAGGPVRSSIDYTLRGGPGNTAMQAMRDTANKKIMDSMKKEFERIMAQKEQGARQIVESFVKKYGPEVKEYIPPETLFYNEKGQFEPFKFAEAAYVGVKKFQEQYPGELASKTEGGTEDILAAGSARNIPAGAMTKTAGYRRAAGREVADILGEEGQTQTGAYRRILERGIDPEAYRRPIETLKDPKEDLDERKVELREAEFAYRTARDETDRELARQRLALAYKKYGLAVDKAQRSFNADISRVNRQIQDIKKQQREAENAYDKWVSDWGETHPSTPEKRRIMEERVQEADEQIADLQQDLEHIKTQKKQAGQEPGMTRTFSPETGAQTGEFYRKPTGQPARQTGAPAGVDVESIKIKLRSAGVPEERMDEAIRELLQRAGM